MKRVFLVSVLVPFLLLTAPNAFAADDTLTPFLGAWEYRQRNSGSPSGYDDQGERLELYQNGGSIQGFYFGLEREGEHGVFYTLVEVEDLEVDSDGRITFVVPERHIYRERPTSLKEIEQGKKPDAGFTRLKMEFRGELKNGYLILQCTADPCTCPEDVMVFRKGYWNQK
jgi:hypothetical protein